MTAMNALNPAQLKRAILRTLDNITDPLLLPESTLIAEASMQLSITPTQAEIDAAIRSLKNEGYIKSIYSKLRDQSKYALTDEGRAAVQEL